MIEGLPSSATPATAPAAAAPAAAAAATAAAAAAATAAAAAAAASPRVEQRTREVGVRHGTAARVAQVALVRGGGAEHCEPV